LSIVQLPLSKAPETINEFDAIAPAETGPVPFPKPVFPVIECKRLLAR
jgi:hypothetical protein